MWEIAIVFFFFSSTLQIEKELEQLIVKTRTLRVKRIFMNDAISLDFCAQNFSFISLFF